jgi:hypothetical protein
VVAAGRDLAHRVVVGFVKIVVYSIGVLTDYESWLGSFAIGEPIRPKLLGCRAMPGSLSPPSWLSAGSTPLVPP